MTHTFRNARILRQSAPFLVDGMAMPYPEFMPRLYNFCMSLGFRSGLIMPSTAFCSDENQGLAIILVTKHFGTFPFNHGRVGGIVAIDRHAPHANHGEDSVILQASHVGYDPHTGEYGMFIRPQMSGVCASHSCGKLSHVITPYLEQYHFARNRIFLHRDSQGRHLITIENSFIDFESYQVKNGLVLNLEHIVKIPENGQIVPVSTLSTAHTYEISDLLRQNLDTTGYQWKASPGEPIGERLTSDLFFFREDFHEKDDFLLLERNLMPFLPEIVTAKQPPLRAAQINVQLEFARTHESIRRGHEYANRNLLFISGLNIDISEYDGYPATTYFVPWAAHVQLKDGTSGELLHPIEQTRLFHLLMQQSTVNKDQTNLKEEISRMLEAPRFDIQAPQE